MNTFHSCLTMANFAIVTKTTTLASRDNPPGPNQSQVRGPFHDYVFFFYHTLGGYRPHDLAGYISILTKISHTSQNYEILY